MTFESLILPAEVYRDFFVMTFKVIIGAIIIIGAVSICLKRLGFEINIPIMVFVNMPKMIISILAVGFVFFYDYSTGTVRLTDFENMYFTTFLVGILALIEVLTCFISIFKELGEIRLRKNY